MPWPTHCRRAGERPVEIRVEARVSAPMSAPGSVPEHAPISAPASVPASVSVNAITVDRVTLALGGRPVLQNVSLSIRSAEFVGVLGPNGAGKTTLMRAILGLVPPAAGTIQVLGAPAARGNA